MEIIRVLILEDDEDIIDLIRSVLEPGYECFVAGNGLEGLQQAAEGEPDLIICDIMMPVMDGWEFMKQLRARPEFNAVPVVFLSALSKQEHIRNGYNLGAAFYFTKPIDPARFKRNLDMLVREQGLHPRPKRKKVAQLKTFFINLLDPPTPIPAPTPAVAPTLAPTPAPALVTPPPPRPAAQPRHGRQSSADAEEEKKADPFNDPEKRPKTLKPVHPPKPAPKPTPARVRLLVVEDDRDTAQMVRSGLSDDYEIVEAPDGITAIERAVRYKPDIFIIDGMLPRMTGYQLTVMLKKNREFFRSPIIFISGKATQRDQQYTQQLGVTRFLAKPFTMQQLGQILKDICAQSDFVMQTDRIAYNQFYLEQFQRLETHRSTQAPATVEQMEKQHLENKLKKHLT